MKTSVPVYRSYEIGSKLVPDPLPGSYDECEESTIVHDHTKGFIYPGGIASEVDRTKSYSLSDPQIYDDLLIEYSKICDADSAFEYVHRRGFPGTMAVPHGKWLITDLIDSAHYLRWLMRLAKDVREENTKNLDSYIKETKSEWSGVFVDLTSPTFEALELVGVIVCDPEDIDGHDCAFESYAGGDRCTLIRMSEEKPMNYKLSVWKQYGSKRSLYAVQRYLKEALERLLIGVQPILDWGITTEDQWVLCETTKVSTPWQAICYGLLLYITGKNNIRPCKNCGKLIQGRGGKTFCGNTCNAAFNRNNESRVHAYPEERKR